ncbi:uncharacterized protein LOC124777495 isoform X2 [Schistocerca piceifrons]|uniref:uncharacterized protein LOC124777495 isoform X2 n=1 Tax=Schistocerca piceifrons TaxID=274613 RepID=UPI001F5EB3A5|nr:uncharacterized protein LOC124777495 isoform X2 [Schistocerca piceifrons]
MPSRSPSRQPSASTSRASRRSPSSFRSRGTGRSSPSEKRRRVEPQPGSSRHGVSPPTSRSRERREFRPSPELGHSEVPEFPMRHRSRSPPMRGSKVRSFSPVPPSKRKMSPSSKRERVPRDVDRERSGRMPSRKRTRSKSPTAASGSHTSATRMVSPAYAEEVSPPQYAGPSDPYGVAAGVDVEHVTRNVGERFRGSSSGKYEETFERPVFRGPDGSAGYDINELKKVVINISRELPVNRAPAERVVINPEDVVLVRRPGEGSRPIFAREEIMQASTERAIIPPVDDHRRIVAIRDVDPPRISGSHSRYEPPSPPPPPRYSEGRSRDAYYVPEHRESATPLTSHRDYGRTHRDYDRPSTSGYERDREMIAMRDAAVMTYVMS